MVIEFFIFSFLYLEKNSLILHASNLVNSGQLVCQKVAFRESSVISFIFHVTSKGLPVVGCTTRSEYRVAPQSMHGMNVGCKSSVNCFRVCMSLPELVSKYNVHVLCSVCVTNCFFGT